MQLQRVRFHTIYGAFIETWVWHIDYFFSREKAELDFFENPNIARKGIFSWARKN